MLSNDEAKKENIKAMNEDFNLFPVVKHILFFLVGWAGLSIIATIVISLFSLYYKSHGIDLSGNASLRMKISIATNLISYLLLTAFLLIIYGKNGIKRVFKEQFDNKHALLDGIAYGFLLLVVGSVIGITVNFLRGGNGGVNDNESEIRLMAKSAAIPMIIMTVILAPICEETTYRLGLFNIVRRKNRWAAYIVTSLVFALIHFTMPDQGSETFKADLINELWNLPSYIASGVILSRAYEKHQSIATSMIAHAINNFVAIMSTILLSNCALF